MSNKLRFDDDRVIKRLEGAANAELLIARTCRLVEAGVPTPAASRGPAADEVAFPRLIGRSGFLALSASDGKTLPALLRPLTLMHGVMLPDLPKFDPALRILPRIGKGDQAVRSALERGLAAIASLSQGRPDATLHGDFHAGQLIMTSDGEAQILDLDDISRGAIEADIGNFAAHLASRPEFNADGVDAALMRWLQETLAGYGGEDTDPCLALAFARVALLRRGVKLRERDGDGSVLVQAIKLCTADR